jgi:hypothetical protein
MKAIFKGGVLLGVLSLLAAPACSAHSGAFHHGGAYGGHAEGQQQKAYDRGYHHGVKAGVKDWERHRPFDPWRHSRYRNADSGYRSRYGPRPYYARAYRAGFREGYERAYGRRGGWRTRRW